MTEYMSCFNQKTHVSTLLNKAPYGRGDSDIKGQKTIEGKERNKSLLI